MRIVIPLRLDDHERVAAHHRFLAVRISLERLARARGLPLRARAVETLRPRRGIIGAIIVVRLLRVRAELDASRHAHMVDLAHPRRIVARVDEVLGPRGAIPDSRPRIRVVERPGRVWIVTRHERRPRRSAVGGITIRTGEPRTSRRDRVNIWRLDDWIAVARESG